MATRLTTQPSLASTGVLIALAMPVSSPYALFRAADHAWPPPMRPVCPVVEVLEGSASIPVDRTVTGRYSGRNVSQSP
jgi:hypothetical protein